MNLKQVILSDASAEAKVSALAILLNKELPKLTDKVDTVKKLKGEQGDRGPKGDKGDKGDTGKDGKDGSNGIDGSNGKDGKDGKDGVSVTDAKIDFDGSLIITLSTKEEINAGEIIAPTLEEKIKLVTSGGAGTVLPDQNGNNGKYLTTDGSLLSWHDAISSISSTDGSVVVTNTSGSVNLSVPVVASTTNIVVQVRNSTGSTLSKGTVVYISGATGQIPTVSKALATSDATSAQTLGLVNSNLANNSNGYVTIIGLVDDIDTSSYTDGQQLYLSGVTAGTLTATKPYAPTHLVYVAVVEYAHPIHGKLFVKVQNGYELDEIHNVSAQSPTNGQTIIYNQTTSLWEKANLTAGTGISVTNGAGSITVDNTGVTSVTATSPVASSGGTTPVISMSAASGTTNGYLTSTDWTTFNNKGNGTVTSVTGVLPVSSTGGSTPIISLASGYGDTQNPYTTKTANYVLASPDGTSGTPQFRALVASDIPTLNQNTTGTSSNVTGIVAVINGGTGASSATTARSNLSAAKSGANTDITSLTLTSGTISTAPSSSTDIVNKSYADSISTGVNFHSACQYATTTSLGTVTYNNGSSGIGATLTNAGTQATLQIDGYTFTSTDVTNSTRILVKNQSTQLQNGVYIVTNIGSASTNWILTRATDYDTSGSGTNEIDQGDLLLVINGTTNSNTSWVQQTPLPITIGTTSIVFIQFAAVQTYTAGTGLTLTTNQFSITNVGTANTYGSASQVPVLTTNAQGQVTAVTNTNIAISGSAVSGNITGNAANVTGTVAIANGGTGATTRQDAMDALAGSTTSGQYLRGNGTDVVMSTIQVTDVPTLNQNTTGTAANVTGTVAIGNGGTGQTSASSAFNALSPITTAGDLIIGSGTNTATRLPIGTNNYVLTSNGTTATWAAAGTGSGASLGAVVATAQGWNMV